MDYSSWLRAGFSKNILSDTLQSLWYNNIFFFGFNKMFLIFGLIVCPAPETISEPKHNWLVNIQRDTSYFPPQCVQHFTSKSPVLIIS